MRKFVFLLLLGIFAFSINALAQTKAIADITDANANIDAKEGRVIINE